MITTILALKRILKINSADVIPLVTDPVAVVFSVVDVVP